MIELLEKELNKALTTVRKVGALKERGSFEENVPKEDIAHAKSYRYWEALADTNDLAAIMRMVPSGFKWYPDKGFISWHTNSDVPGRRCYAIHNFGSGSYFKTEKGIEMEPAGWTIRVFETPIWHCVYANCERIAFGFRLN